MNFLHCDNYATCQMTVRRLDTDQATDNAARAKGWHIWEGQTMGGHQQRKVICPKCMGSNRSRLPIPPPRLPGDRELIQFEILVGDDE
jgi:hypothetical protein